MNTATITNERPEEVSAPGLTDAQTRALAAIMTFIEANGFPPTGGELSTELGYRKKQTGSYMIDALHRKGYVDRDPSRARGYRILRDVAGNRVMFGLKSREVPA